MIKLKGELIESNSVRYSPGDTGISERIVVIGNEVWDARREQLMVRLPSSYAIVLRADGRRLLIHTGGEGRTIWSLPAMPAKLRTSVRQGSAGRIIFALNKKGRSE